MSLIPTGAYINNTTPWWSLDTFGTPANVEVSTLTVNPVPAGNILLQNPAPLIFQRAPGDVNAPSESLVMISSVGVPTKPVNGQYITATKALGTAYDDIAVQGLQVYGNQTTSGNTGAAAYITGSNGNLILVPQNSVLISSLQVSSLVAGSVVSTTTNTATSYTATLFMSTPILNANFISSVGISTNVIGAVTGNFSTANISTLNAPNFQISTVNTSTVNSVFSDTKVSLTSTLSLFGNVNVDLGLGNQIAGLVGGAAGQALGVGIGGAGLITGAAALVTGRTSGGVNSNVFQTINGSTQLQFSTIGAPTTSVFLTTNSLNPLTTPGLEISTTLSVAAGTYCVRSVGDPLYINNNVSSIQMFGQWVPVIQPTATVPALAISSLGVSSVNGAVYPPPGGGGIPSTLAISSATVNGNFTQSGTGTLNWGGNTLSFTQVVLSQPTSVNNTLTTTGAAFLNAGATVNGSSLTVGVTTPLIVNNTARINNLSTVFISTANINLSSVNGAIYPPPAGTPTIPSTLALSTVTVNGGQSISNGGLTVSGGTSVLNAGATVNGGLTVASGTTSLQSGTTISNGLTVVGGMNVTSGTVTLSGSAQINGSALFLGNTTFNANASVNQNLTVSNGLTVYGGTVQFNPSVTMLNNLTLPTGTVTSPFGAFSNINISSINGATYPPGGGGGGIPSTLNASTINFNGGLTNVGSAPITTGTINVTTVNANDIQSAAISTNILSTNIIRAAAISSFNISTNNINVNTINGAPYSPGGTTIPSTLNASTINVNGGIRVNSGGLTVSGGNVGISTTLGFNNSATFQGVTDFRVTLGSSANRLQFVQNPGNNDSIIMDINADKTTRLYSTLLVRDSTWPSVLPSFASIRTYDTSDLAPYGSVITGNVSTFGLHSHTATLTTLITSNLFVGSNANLASISTTNISATNLNATNLATANINVSSINSAPYPPLGVPIGSITIWAGGSDTGGNQNFNVPAGWFVCDGSEKDKLIYANLYGVIGEKYAMNKPLSGTNFYLPDLTFAVPMGTPMRNYAGTLNLGAPSFQCSVQTWTSDFAPSTLSSPTQTWKISQTVGGTLNYGTFFPANAITQPGYPSVYVSNILSYDGNVGYVVVRSINNSNIPQTLGTIIARGSGTVPQDNSGTYLYTLGSYGADSGYPQVTHNQTGAEVGGHTHSYNRYGLFGSTGLANGNIDPSKSSAFQDTGSNQISSISTVGATNVGTYTAPNFLNMLYIIKF